MNPIKIVSLFSTLFVMIVLGYFILTQIHFDSPFMKWGFFLFIEAIIVGFEVWIFHILNKHQNKNIK